MGWDVQPPPGTPIDWSNPITFGLTFLVTGNDNGRDAVHGIRPTSRDVIEGSNQGRALRPTANVAWQYGDNDVAKASASPALTVMGFARSSIADPGGSGDDHPGPAWGPQGAANVRFRWDPTSPTTHDAALNIRTDVALVTSRIVGGLQPSQGGQDPERWNLLGGTYDGALVVCRVNKRRDVGVALTGVILGGTAPLNVGANSTGDNVWDGLVAMNAIWSRALSDGEWHALVDNPWQLFRRDESPTGFVGAVVNDMSATSAVTFTDTAALEARGQLAANDPVAFTETADINSLGVLRVTDDAVVFGETALLTGLTNAMLATSIVTFTESAALTDATIVVRGGVPDPEDRWRRVGRYRRKYLGEQYVAPSPFVSKITPETTTEGMDAGAAALDDAIVAFEGHLAVDADVLEQQLGEDVTSEAHEFEVIALQLRITELTEAIEQTRQLRRQVEEESALILAIWLAFFDS